MRLRQVALVARHLQDATTVLEGELGLREPFADPGVGEFGLENAVYAVGTSFVEVVAPVRPDTTAGRYLDRRGGDGGYMAIFQVDDLAAARQRVADLGIRVVWSADLPGIAGTHLHPKDVPGAIVSLDWADPPESWHWAGPAWRGGAPPEAAGGIVGLTVAAADPEALAARWASVLGVTTSEPTTIDLVDSGQRIVFTSGDDGIVGVELAVPGDGERTATVGSVRIELRGGS
jgi:catechol 2,3-dioxygenase-like lactoylglutathione lyase family enzyme